MKSILSWMAVLCSVFSCMTANAKIHHMIIAQDPEKVSIYLDESIPGLNLTDNKLVILSSEFEKGGKYEGLPNPVADLKNLKPFLIAYAERLKLVAIKNQMNRFIERSISSNPMVETEELSKSVEGAQRTPEHQAADGFYDVAAKLAE